MLLVSIVLWGGAWYLNTTGVLDGLSSSVFGPTFVCSEENLKKQAKEYRQKIIQQRKANIYRDELESTIIALRDAGNTTEMQQKQKSLRTLIRWIGAYNRFIKSYSACQKKVQNTTAAAIPVPESLPVLNSAPMVGYDASRETGGAVIPSTPPVNSPSIDTKTSVSPVAPIVQPPVTQSPVVETVPETTEPPIITHVPETTEPPVTQSPVVENAPETTEPPAPSV